MFAALLTLIVSRTLLGLLTEYGEGDAMFLPERWAATFREHAQLILRELSQHFGYSPPSLLERMAEDAQKIHQERTILQERLATATQQTTEC